MFESCNFPLPLSEDGSTNGQKLEEVTGLKYLEATLCKDGTCSAEVSISIDGNGQSKQDIVVQRHQFRKQVQALQVSCHFYLPLWL